MLSAGKDEAAVLQALEVTQSTYERWRKQYHGMKAAEARRLKELEDENRRLKQIVAKQTLDIEMLEHITPGNLRQSMRIGHGGVTQTAGNNELSQQASDVANRLSIRSRIRLIRLIDQVPGLLV